MFMMDNRIKLELDTRRRSACSSCAADTTGHLYGRKAERFYELTIGGMAVTMCHDCICKLEHMIQQLDE